MSIKPRAGLRAQFCWAAIAAFIAVDAVAGPPTISGSPSQSAIVGNTYSFRPTASDPDGNTLGFSISNRPSWASFNTVSGRLSGTPASGSIGKYSNIIISVSDGKTKVSLPSFSITVKSGTAPTISGTMPTTVKAGSSYSFTPKASDPNGDKLTFSIKNKPSWTSFSSSTGRLSGTPAKAHIGGYSNIIISVSDGKTAVSLKAFTINVTAASTGAATVSWMPPTRNSDGSTLSNLNGYRIYYGTSSSSLNKTIQISNPSLSSYVVENLLPGKYYFGVKALTSGGTESGMSNVGTKTIQ
jgi:Putative Ig domain